MEKEREAAEIVNDSVSTATSMEYVSPRKKYVIYNKMEVKKQIETSEEMIEESPDYLEQEEEDFLKEFISVFKQSYTQTSYNVKPKDYVNLILSGINAIKKRVEHDRQSLIQEADQDTEKAERIQYLFYNIQDMMYDIQEEVIENFDTYSANPEEFKSYRTRIEKICLLLNKAYAFEFSYLEDDQEVSIEEIEEAIESSATLWKMEISNSSDTDEAFA